MGSSAVHYGSERPDGYRPRIIDARLQRALSLFGAVEVRGPKWCGKSWSSLAFGESVIHLDDADARAIVEAQPALALTGDRPHVVDEWREVPTVWDAARRAVDAAGGQKGLFILTGSSAPAKDLVTHSGAGRIAGLDMTTMTLWEQGLSAGTVSLSGLFGHEFEPSAECGDIPRAAQAICRGGWPDLLGAAPADAVEVVEQYLGALAEVETPKRGGTPSTMRRVLASLARNVGTAATIRTLAEDMDSDMSGTTASSTVQSYLSILRNSYVLDELSGWDAPVRSKSRVRTKPKRYFADPSIPAALLGTSPSRLLADGQTLGLLFESLCIHDLRVYASLLEGAPRDALHHYTDSDGLEVDAVIELRDGRWAAIEVRLGENGVPKGIDNLLRLRDKVAANPAARNPAPEFMAVLAATTPMCRRDAETGVYVFPLAALRP